MSITATELKSNLSKYLILSATEDVYITRNGKVISKLTNPFRERVDIAKSLFGILPDDVTEEEARDERLGKESTSGYLRHCRRTPMQRTFLQGRARSDFSRGKQFVCRVHHGKSFHGYLLSHAPLYTQR